MTEAMKKELVNKFWRQNYSLLGIEEKINDIEPKAVTFGVVKQYVEQSTEAKARHKATIRQQREKDKLVG